MKYQFSIAVVLLNWNAFEQTCECIELLQSIKALPIKIMVVDNGSADDSVLRIREKYPTVRLICNKENLGFAGGNNSALREILASGEPTSSLSKDGSPYVLLLNTDAGIDEKSLQALVATLEQDDHVGVTGPVFVKKENRNELITAGGLDPSLHINTYRDARKVKAELQKGKPLAVDYVSGTVALIRISALEKCGSFETEYFFSCEMADLCYRLKDHGYDCCITPASKAWHEMGKAGGRRDTLYLYYILRNRFLFIRRCRSKFIVPLYVMWIAISCLFFFKSILRRKTKTARAIILALRDGLFGRYGGRNYLFSEVLESDG